MIFLLRESAPETEFYTQAKLNTQHEVVVRNRLEQLRKKQRDEALQAQEELLAGVVQSIADGRGPRVAAQSEPLLSSDIVEPYSRAMSPGLVDITKLGFEERQIDIMTELEDKQALVRQFAAYPIMLLIRTLPQIKARRLVAGSRFVPKPAQREQLPPEEMQEAASGADLASEALYRAEAERELDEEEELFNLEENIANPTSYNWEDKYRPRKPRYFNRVHTGYEWNKYNQTHYE